MLRHFRDLVAVDRLLARHPDPSRYLPEDRSVGGLAAGNADVLVHLSRKGIDVRAPSRDGSSVFDQAGLENLGDDDRTEVASAHLVAVGAEPRGHEEHLKWYLGPHFRNRLFQAVRVGHAGLTKLALDDGADPDVVLVPGGVTILQYLEGHPGDGTLEPFRQPLGRSTQACLDVIRAHLAARGGRSKAE